MRAKRMQENEVFSFAGLAIILVAIGAAFAMRFLPLPPLSLGIAAVTLTAVLLAWRVLALRRYREMDGALLARPPWGQLILTLFLVGVSVELLFMPIDEPTAMWWYFLAIFLGVLLYAGFLPTTLLYWAATPEGLVRGVLSFTKTLAWQQIDWVYGKQRRMTQDAVAGLTVARWTEETLIVEAGPMRRITIVLRAPLVATDVTPLLKAIREHASHARFGFDQFPAVAAARANRPYAPPDPSGGVFSLAAAVRLAQTAPDDALPSGWMRFPLRRRNAWQNAITLPLLGVALFAGTVYLYLNGVFLFSDWAPKTWLVDPQLSWLLIGQSAVLAAGAIWLYVFGLSWFRPLGALHQYFFLVTPLGFVEARGPRLEKARGASFDDVRDVKLGTGMFGWQLQVSLRSGKTLELDIGSNYGPGRELYAYVVAGLSASRTARSAGRVTGALASELVEGD